MNRSETALILAKVQAFDRRTVGDVDVAAWHEALDDVDPALAADAVTAHFRGSTAWLMPQHIRTHVRSVELQRLRDAGPPDYPTGLDLVGERRYRELWQEQVRRGATREQATVQVDTVLGHARGELANRNVAQAIEGMFSTRTRPPLTDRRLRTSSRTESRMTCPEHPHCARTGAEGHLCPFCHCSFAVITMPATEVTRRPGKSKDGTPIMVEETRWLFGRGELPLQHLTGHVEDRRRMASKAAKLAERKAAA